MGGEEENCEKKDALLEQNHEAKNAWVVQLAADAGAETLYTMAEARKSKNIPANSWQYILILIINHFTDLNLM